MLNLLGYELSQLEKAIEGISKLLEKYHQKPAQFEYYLTMQECFLALNHSMDEMRRTREAYENLFVRIEIMERLLRYYTKEKKHDGV